MHVAIDARELVGHATGAGRYLARLLDQWATMPAARAHRYTLYAHGPVGAPPAGLNADVVLLPGTGGTRWEQATLGAALRRNRPDVLFAPAYSAPVLCPAPLVLSVHDVSFAAHPEWYRPRERLLRSIVPRLSARRARVVLTLSEFSRSEIVRLLGVPPDRVRVIPLGLGLRDGPSLARPAADRDPTILFVGSLFTRRHVDSLVRAMPLVRARIPAARLVLVGDNRTWPPEDPAVLAQQQGVASAVTVTSYVDDRRLEELYERASVFAFLSEYEGFGLTPLEALAAGVPILVLDTPVAREVYGPAARYVPTPDPAVVADALVELFEPAHRAALLAHAPGVLGRYRWSAAAEATHAAIEGAARP